MQGVIITLRFDVGKIRCWENRRRTSQHPVDSNGRDQGRNAGRRDQREREGAYRLCAPPIIPGERKHDQSIAQRRGTDRA